MSSSTSVSDSASSRGDDEFFEIECHLKTGDEVALADTPESVGAGFAIGVADGDGHQAPARRGTRRASTTGRPTPVASTITLHGFEAASCVGDALDAFRYDGIWRIERQTIKVADGEARAAIGLEGDGVADVGGDARRAR